MYRKTFRNRKREVEPLLNCQLEKKDIKDVVYPVN